MGFAKSKLKEKCVVLLLLLLAINGECKRYSGSGGSRRTNGGSSTRHTGGSSSSHYGGFGSGHSGSSGSSGSSGGSRPIGFEHINREVSRPAHHQPPPSHNRPPPPPPLPSGHQNQRIPSAPPLPNSGSSGSHGIPPIYRPPQSNPKPIGFDHDNRQTNSKPLGSSIPSAPPLPNSGTGGSHGIPPIYKPPQSNPRPLGFDHDNRQTNSKPLGSSIPSAPPLPNSGTGGSHGIPPIYRPPQTNPKPIGFDNDNRQSNSKPLGSSIPSAPPLPNTGGSGSYGTYGQSNPKPIGNSAPIGFEGINQRVGTNQGSHQPPLYNPNQGSYHPNQGTYQHPPSFTNNGRVPYHPQVSPGAFPGQTPTYGHSQPHYGQPHSQPVYNSYVQSGPTYHIHNAVPNTPNYHAYPLYQPTVVQKSGSGFGGILSHGAAFGGGYLIGRLTSNHGYGGGYGGGYGSHYGSGYGSSGGNTYNTYNNYNGNSNSPGYDPNNNNNYNNGNGGGGGSGTGTGGSTNNYNNHYTVHHYYENRETIPRRLAVKETNLGTCVANTTENLCVPNTYAVCLKNATIMCVTHTQYTVPCENETCVISVLPCTPENPACTANQTITPMSIPCISNVSISDNNLSGDKADPKGNDYCVTAIAEPELKLVRCALNATESFCLGNTYAVCLGNGTVFCVSHVNNVISCGSAIAGECVSTKRPCTKTDLGCNPNNPEYIFELSQCLNKISIANERILNPRDIYKYSTSDEKNLRVDYCVAKIVEPKPPGQAGLDWLKEGAKLVLLNFNQTVPAA